MTNAKNAVANVAPLLAGVTRKDFVVSVGVQVSVWTFCILNPLINDHCLYLTNIQSFLVLSAFVILSRFPMFLRL